MVNGFVGLIRAAQVKEGTGDGTAWSAIMEIVILVFFISIIPDLLSMDPRSMTIYDFWKPILSAMLAAAYAYIRARGLNVEAAEAKNGGH